MFAKKSNFLYNIGMPKVYYGKDSITPSFLQSNHDSDSEVFRSQVAKDSLRQSEESSLESSSVLVYVLPKNSKNTHPSFLQLVLF